MRVLREVKGQVMSSQVFIVQLLTTMEHGRLVEASTRRPSMEPTCYRLLALFSCVLQCHSVPVFV